MVSFDQRGFSEHQTQDTVDNGKRDGDNGADSLSLLILGEPLLAWFRAIWECQVFNVRRALLELLQAVAVMILEIEVSIDLISAVSFIHRDLLFSTQSCIHLCLVLHVQQVDDQNESKNKQQESHKV